MTRAEFLKKSMTIGLGLPFLSLLLESCAYEGVVMPEFKTNFSGKVIVVGAGAAGMAAGYLLQRHGVDFEILEAGETFGGRLKRLDNFADFPIDAGAEWIHTSPAVLSEILNDPTQNADVDLVVYNPQTVQVWNNGKLRNHNYIRKIYSEYKFKSTTWFGFFEEFILPSVRPHLRFNEAVAEVDYSADKVRLTTENGTVHEADKVLLTVPLKVLQDERIAFSPTLPTEKTAAIQSISFGDGLKMFFEFKERFYPDMLFFGNILKSFNADDKIFYDAAFGKNSKKHIMGVFTINDKASEYIQLGAEEAMVARVLEELDEIFDGKGSAHYVKHAVQNWSANPYIRGSYSFNFEENQGKTIETLKQPLNDRVYFAGEALSWDHQATVHGACEAAYDAVSRMLKA